VSESHLQYLKQVLFDGLRKIGEREEGGRERGGERGGGRGREGGGERESETAQMAGARARERKRARGAQDTWASRMEIDSDRRHQGLALAPHCLHPVLARSRACAGMCAQHSTDLAGLEQKRHHQRMWRPDFHPIVQPISARRTHARIRV